MLPRNITLHAHCKLGDMLAARERSQQEVNSHVEIDVDATTWAHLQHQGMGLCEWAVRSAVIMAGIQ